MGQPPQGESWADPGERTERAATPSDGSHDGASAPDAPAPPAWPAPDQPERPSARPDLGPPAPQGGPSAPPGGPPAPAGWQPTSFASPGSVPPGPGANAGAPPVPVAPPMWGNPGAPQPPAGPPAGQSMYGARPEQAPAPQQTGAFGQFTFPVIPKQPLEPLAVAGVATAPLGVVGVVLGLLARGRVRRRRTRSMRLAWTGVALGAVFTVVWVLVGSVLAFDGTLERALESPEAGDVDAPRTIASANLAVGNCIATLQPAEAVGDVRLVPCAQEHIAQVVTIEQLTGSFPGDEALADRATATCDAAVGGVDAGDAQIQPWYLVPSETGWAQGNTSIVCLLRGSAGPIQVDLVNT